MMKRKACFITDADRCRLGSFVLSHEGRAWGRAASRSSLDDRLEEAKYVDQARTPRDLVTMNSTVELLDLKSRRRSRRTLIYPIDADVVPDGISVLDPLGTQLLGHCVGDTILDGKRSFRITKILYQPEAAGNTYL